MDGVEPPDDSEALDDLGRELRERVGKEMRQEAELLEQDAATVELRRRRLADIAIELVSRGDIVTIIAGDRSLRGRLTYARGEIASVEAPVGRVDVHLPAGVVVRVDERSTDGGRTPRKGSDTMRARLLELELAGTDIEVWVPSHGIDVSGTIVAVGKDHVVVRDRDDSEWAILLYDIAWVSGI
ncbi:MAG: hypothetical protein ACR2NL_06285 [Acidimicrobiia bacterium]